MIRSIGLWSVIGFVVGTFWVALAFAFFTAPQSPVVDRVKLIAAITCPPFMFTDIFVAPLLNAAVYASAAFIWLRVMHIELAEELVQPPNLAYLDSSVKQASRRSEGPFV